MRDADHDAAEDIDDRDDQGRDRIAADEFRGAVHRAEEGAFLFELAPPRLRFLLVDQAGRKVGVDRHLLARNGIESEARADFRDTRRTLGDHDEIHRDQDSENDQADDEVAAHDEIGESGHDVAGRGLALIAMRQDEPRRADIEREPQDGREQEHGWKGGKFQRPLDPERHHQNQGRQGDGDREAEIDQQRGDRQDQDRDDGHDSEGEQHVAADPPLRGGRHHLCIRHQPITPCAVSADVG